MKRLLVLLLLTYSAFAQSPATVTGAVQDAGGSPATSGTVVFTLQPTNQGVQYFVSGTATIAPQSVTCGIDGSGNVKNLALTGACTVYGVDVITPANLTYTVQFYPNGVSTAVNTVAQECITGSSYNLNIPRFCPVIKVTPQSVTVITNPVQSNLIPGSAHVFSLGSSPLPYASLYVDNIFSTLGSMTLGSITVLGTGTFGNLSNANIKGPNPWWDVCQNGLACDNATDDKSAFNTLLTTACAGGGGTLWFPPGKIIRFASAPNHIPCGLTLAGAYSKGSTFNFGSFVKCDYTEITPTNACLWLDGANAATQGNGGGIQGINIQKGDGKTGGVAYRISGTDCTARAGNTHNNSIKISSNTGTWDYDIYIDGTTCTTAGSTGSRDNYFSDIELFSSTTKAVSLNGCVHCQFLGLETSLGAGSNAGVDITGTAGVPSTEINISGAGIGGSLTYDRTTTTNCSSCNVNGTLSSTVNTTQSSFEGVATAYALINGVSLTAYDQAAVASQNATRVETLRAARSVGAGPTYPTNIGDGFVWGSLFTREDGQCGFKWNNGSGVRTNLAYFGCDGTTILFNIDPVNGVVADTLPITVTALKLKNGSTATITPNSLAANRAISINDPLALATLPTYLSAFDNTVDLASVASGACTTERTVTVTGARFGDPVQVMAGTALEAGGFLIGKVTGADTTKWQFCNLSGGAIDRASDSYTVKVTK